MTFESLINHFGTRGFGAADVQRYLDAGGDVNRRASASGWTLLHFAAENRDLEIIRLLVARGADLAATDQNGWTPLHLAVDSDLDTSKRNARVATEMPTARLLIELGADETARSTDGLTARDMAKDYKQEELYDSVSRTRPTVP